MKPPTANVNNDAFINYRNEVKSRYEVTTRSSNTFKLYKYTIT